MQTITVETTIHAPIDLVWDVLTKPEHIVQWAFASDDWEAQAAENDLRVGGRFKTIMAAKDKSASFDFTGTYTAVQEHALIEYTMDDNRKVKTEFQQTPEGVRVTQTFEMESENSEDVQRSGWQAILDNMKAYAESLA